MFYFKLQNSQACEEILNQQWQIMGRPVWLRRWCPGIEPLKMCFEKVPVWVRLYNIPAEYWTIEGVGCVASAIGVPIQTDSPPEEAPRLSYARVCVEVIVRDNLPDEIELEISDGVIVLVRVEYAWKPEWCEVCKVVGHSLEKCPGAVGTLRRKPRGRSRNVRRKRSQVRNVRGVEDKGVHSVPSPVR